MTDFHKNVENIKTFRSLLDVIITRVESGEKVDFDAISKLNEFINNYYESCREETTEEEEVIIQLNQL